MEGAVYRASTRTPEHGHGPVRVRSFRAPFAVVFPKRGGAVVAGLFLLYWPLNAEAPVQAEGAMRIQLTSSMMSS